MFIRTPYWYFKNAVDSFFIKALTEATKKEKTIVSRLNILFIRKGNTMAGIPIWLMTLTTWKIQILKVR